MERYVSLSGLATERHTQIAVLKQELDEAGIEPAFDLGVRTARFYERTKLVGLGACSSSYSSPTNRRIVVIEAMTA